MKRFCKPSYKKAEIKKVDDFINEVLGLCKKYNLSIGHEDTEGGFIVHEGYKEENADWLKDATYEMGTV
jgi:hypothetical protein